MWQPGSGTAVGSRDYGLLLVSRDPRSVTDRSTGSLPARTGPMLPPSGRGPVSPGQPRRRRTSPTLAVVGRGGRPRRRRRWMASATLRCPPSSAGCSSSGLAGTGPSARPCRPRPPLTGPGSNPRRCPRPRCRTRPGTGRPSRRRPRPSSVRGRTRPGFPVVDRPAWCRCVSRPRMPSVASSCYQRAARYPARGSVPSAGSSSGLPSPPASPSAAAPPRRSTPGPSAAVRAAVPASLRSPSAVSVVCLATPS